MLVISLLTGAHGLDLPQTTHVFMMDLWWNPAVHEQAEARAVRIGQTRQVQVAYILASDTIETAMKDILAHKKRVNSLVVKDTVTVEVDGEGAVDVAEHVIASMGHWCRTIDYSLQSG